MAEHLTTSVHSKEEEKEAIEYLKRIITLNKKDGIENSYAEIVLNLIEKQSKEIEKLKEIKFENERTIELFIEGYKRIYKELDIKSLVVNENILINEIKENFTSKDKIKAKIEELDNPLSETFKSLLNAEEPTWSGTIKQFLQSLLEKE